MRKRLRLLTLDLLKIICGNDSFSTETVNVGLLPKLSVNKTFTIHAFL